jgi:chlorite dismutase
MYIFMYNGLRSVWSGSCSLTADARRMKRQTVMLLSVIFLSYGYYEHISKLTTCSKISLYVCVYYVKKDTNWQCLGTKIRKGIYNPKNRD